MRILFIGDIFGSPGRAAVTAFLKRERSGFDLVIANAENTSSGRGLTARHFSELRDAGIDVMTMGNHTWDQKETAELLEESARLIRPANYPPGTPGLGHTIVTARGGGRVAVAQVMGRVFMDPLDDPFRTLDGIRAEVPSEVPLVVDVHAEATSEKKAIAWYLRGRAAAVLGTHTHVQTADEAVHGGTASITDVGLTGVADSAIGMGFEEVHYRFTARRPLRYRPAEGRAAVNAVVIALEGPAAVSIERIWWWHEQ